MKRILLSVIISILFLPPAASAQDAAVEERLTKLTGQIEDLLAAKVEQDKRIVTLARELETLRDQSGRGGAYASAEDLRKLAEKLQEIDRKRQEDNERILREIEKLAKLPPATRPSPRPPKQENNPPEKAPGAGAVVEKGIEHVIQSGDRLETIAHAYSKEKGIKVTVDQILKANPGLKPERLMVGQKVFIPLP